MNADSKEDYTLLEYETLEFDVPLQDNRFPLNALKNPLRLLHGHWCRAIAAVTGSDP